MGYILILALTALSVYVAWQYRNLCKNIATVKHTGLPYIVIPISNYHPLWLATFSFMLPLARRLPSSWTASWINYMTPDWCWRVLYEPFSKIGDNFFLVSFDNIFLFTADADVINQIASRRDAFPRPIENYTLLNIFGRNLVSTEGDTWKTHRKIISPNMNEKNNSLVFTESCYEAKQMVDRWVGKGHNITLTQFSSDTMQVALHIITQVGFGVKLQWRELEEDHQKQVDTKFENGHTMSLATSTETVLSCLPAVSLLPSWFLRNIPVKAAQVADQAFQNFRQYVQEMLDEKIRETKEGKASKGMDIMGALVRSSYGGSPSGSRAGSPKVAEPVLTDGEIMGNAFVMLFAGHETTANSIHFSLIELAINPNPQKEAQKEILRILGDKAPEEWDYDICINKLLGSMLGAILNEQLRLMPPGPTIPKSVTKDCDQVVKVEGKDVVLPAGANIGVNAIGVQRNPKYWPKASSNITNGKDDLDEFRPERWFVKAGATRTCSSSDSQAGNDHARPTEDSPSAELFRPISGSYIPFSAGAHSCLGRRLAQIEVVAVLAVIFQKYSIELAVEEWATDSKVEKMSKTERRAVYQKAQIKARETLRSASVVLTLKLTQAVPMRLTKKGKERFFDLFE